MGRKRFKDQILRQILEVCAGVGATKTQIFYSCNLNFHTVVSYLNMLIKNGLVERVEGEHIRHRPWPQGGETAATAL
jgi:predicted transcriptional regulator